MFHCFVLYSSTILQNKLKLHVRIQTQKIFGDKDRSNKKSKMVCVACLLPLFLIPIVNLLPVLFDIIMARVYRILGWEYRKPERAPAACPYKPVANKTNENVTGEHNPIAADLAHKALPADSNGKLD
ncbi:hypothetical protein L6452_08834 [Arctium lappa]|uniref:Uncharacterized protein n=1 Tax=Arctium lappa TaxID=4217 RepID=A0ACB9DIN7_ARCLA|nr:hypothetical protein L6452_08834 [Arctium lappa]